MKYGIDQAIESLEFYSTPGKTSAPDYRACQMAVVALKTIKGWIGTDILRPKGRWEWYDFTVSQRSIDRGYMCSVCASKQEDETNFCPNCGADMREDGK